MLFDKGENQMKKKKVCFFIIVIFILGLITKYIYEEYQYHQKYKENMKIINYACEKSGQTFEQVTCGSGEDSYTAEITLNNADKGENLPAFFQAFNEYLFMDNGYFLNNNHDIWLLFSHGEHSQGVVCLSCRNTDYTMDSTVKYDGLGALKISEYKCIGEELMKNLSDFENLQVLILDECDISDKMIEGITKMKKLEVLDMDIANSNKITDELIKKTGVRLNVELYDDFADNSIQKLGQMTSLKNLKIGLTNGTNAKRWYVLLKEKLPECTIKFCYDTSNGTVYVGDEED